MERVVNQNANEEIYHDYKFLEDERDNLREDGKGDLHALWRFTSMKAKSNLFFFYNIN